jgi:hypothetical protein
LFKPAGDVRQASDYGVDVPGSDSHKENKKKSLDVCHLKFENYDFRFTPSMKIEAEAGGNNNSQISNDKYPMIGFFYLDSRD